MFVDVSVLVAQAPSSLTYALPAALAADAEALVGRRVVVTLAGRRVTGVVIGARQSSPTGVTPQLLSEVLDERAVVSASQLDVARFVSRYYEAPLQDALRLVLPPDTLAAPKRRFRLTLRGEQVKVFFRSDGLNAGDVAVLHGLDVGVTVEHARLRRAGATPTRLKKLVSAGLLEEVAAQRPVTAVRVVERLVLVAGGRELPRAARAARALEAWIAAWTGERSAPPTIVDADVAVGRARAKVQALVAHGRLRVEEEPVTPVRARVAGKGAASSLTAAQGAAAGAIVAAIAARTPTSFLLEGVTGSGKTEVYLRAILACLSEGRGAIVIVPEIALTPQLTARVEAAVPEPVIVLHSGLSEADRRDSLARLRAGHARVVVGARSAVFAPLAEGTPLGLVIVDEEHEPSLKQDEMSPRYHAKDVALYRAHAEEAVCVLGSATPSLESRHNVVTGKLNLLRLPERVGGAGLLPRIELVDLKLRKGVAVAKKKDRAVADEHGGVVLSAPLVDAMAGTLRDGEQVLVFLNRRGWSSTVTCDSCGTMRLCPQCSVALTLHAAGRDAPDGRRRGPASPHLRCHQCGYAEAFVSPGSDGPPPCPSCGEDGLVMLGTGTERVEAEVRARFPDARVVRLDRDAVASHEDVTRAIAQIQAREVDVVIGTQMVAKGHDWPAVRLVGIVLADVALGLPDFRAGERALALLAQVAGRAGRGGGQGRVVVQTYDPSHPVLLHLVDHDVAGFADAELRVREAMRYPPFSRLARVRVEHEDERVAYDVVHELKSSIERAGAGASSWWRVLGPAPCAIERVQGRARVQLLVFAAEASLRARLLAPLRAASLRKVLLAERSAARVIVDVDPSQML